MNASYDPNSWDELPCRAYRRNAFGSLLIESHRRIKLLCHDINSPAWNIGHKLASCCSQPQIISLNNGERYYLTESRCRSRLCPRCSKIRARMLAQRVGALVHHMDSPRFLTLTIRSHPGDLRDLLKFLRTRFAMLRRTLYWKSLVRGGIYTVEITWNAKSKEWHPHLHAIIDGNYIPQADLVKVWSQVVGDDAGVDIRKVSSIRKISNYLAAYVSKSCDLSNLPPDQLVEWAIETHALRLAQTFGSYHANKPSEDRVMCCSYSKLQVDVNQLAYKAELGDEKCLQVLSALSGSSACDRPDFLFLVARAIPPPVDPDPIISVRLVDRQINFQFDDLKHLS